ncbi:hypothetical protein DY926_08495 [Komagataeibacter melaceti]|uniref:DNA-directed RNA polymerase n=1 Tax=Komagataeibacter melaceti TaxID=2766577 RepID=A0A371Z0I2_9PROT|nr:hypothetical protein DY926_08495 [Komagataeibacter melaceti]
MQTCPSRLFTCLHHVRGGYVQRTCRTITVRYGERTGYGRTCPIHAPAARRPCRARPRIRRACRPVARHLLRP